MPVSLIGIYTYMSIEFKIPYKNVSQTYTQSPVSCVLRLEILQLEP